MTATLPSSFLGIVFPCSCRVLMGVEPLANIRDGILVERLVKTMQYIADMRRCQYVVQRPEGVRRRQRLNVEYGDVRSIAKHRPIGALKRHISVIVQNSDLVLLHWHPSRGD